MVDRLTKFLRKRDRKTALLLVGILEQMASGNLSAMEVKKLKGKKNIFRIRKGRIRIIFEKRADKIFVLKVDYRDDRTYDGF